MKALKTILYQIQIYPQPLSHTPHCLPTLGCHSYSIPALDRTPGTLQMPWSTMIPSEPPSPAVMESHLSCCSCYYDLDVFWITYGGASNIVFLVFGWFCSGLFLIVGVFCSAIWILGFHFLFLWRMKLEFWNNVLIISYIQCMLIISTPHPPTHL